MPTRRQPCSRRQPSSALSATNDESVAVRRVGPVLERAVVVDDVDDDAVCRRASWRARRAAPAAVLGDRLELGLGVVLGCAELVGCRPAASGRSSAPGHCDSSYGQRRAVEGAGDREAAEPSPRRRRRSHRRARPSPSPPAAVPCTAAGRTRRPGRGRSPACLLSSTRPRPTTGPSAAGTSVGIGGAGRSAAGIGAGVDGVGAAGGDEQQRRGRASQQSAWGYDASAGAGWFLRAAAGPGRPAPPGDRCRTAPPRGRAAALARRAGARIRSTIRCSSSASNARIHS